MADRWYAVRVPQEPKRVLTLEEVNALLPRVSELVGRQLDVRREIQGFLARLGELTGDVPERIVLDPADPADLRALKRGLVEHIERYRAGWRELEEMGGVLKDSRLGLVDFYGQVDGKLVWLCWKYGEEEVGFYHALDEGFSARRLLAHSMRHRLLN